MKIYREKERIVLYYFAKLRPHAFLCARYSLNDLSSIVFTIVSYNPNEIDKQNNKGKRKEKKRRFVI